MSWSGCPACENCEDREPYTKCSGHCIAYKKYRAEYERQKKQEKIYHWLDRTLSKKGARK